MTQRDCGGLPRRDFIRRGAPGLTATSVLHQGACADTTESDGRYMLDNNFTYSKELLHWAVDRRVPARR